MEARPGTTHVCRRYLTNKLSMKPVYGEGLGQMMLTVPVQNLTCSTAMTKDCSLSYMQLVAASQAINCRNLAKALSRDKKKVMDLHRGLAMTT